ncbi:MAG: FKBP-type peptidyl-prolyl cis-trans isomerase [Flavobacteriales bacterium]
MKHIALFAVALLLIAGDGVAQDNAKPKKEKKSKASGTAKAGPKKSGQLLTHSDSLAYALGVSMFANTAEMGFGEFDFDQFVKGMEAKKSGNSTMSLTSADSLIRAEMQRITSMKTEKNRADGEAFLAANKTKPGVMTTASGLQYKVEREGNGKKPDSNDKVTVHYHGTLIDGTIFDSSVNRGKTTSFGLNQVIPGWTEGLQLMSEGAKYTFYIPQNLAYGSRGQGKIQPFSTLIFEVELFTVETVN